MSYGCQASSISVSIAAAKHAEWHLGDLYTESGQTLQGSFSAVSKPNFASKCSCESSRRDLNNTLLCTALVESVWELSKLNFLFKNIINNFKNVSKFAESRKKNLINSADAFLNVDAFFSEFCQNAG